MPFISTIKVTRLRSPDLKHGGRVPSRRGRDNSQEAREGGCCRKPGRQRRAWEQDDDMQGGGEQEGLTIPSRHAAAHGRPPVRQLARPPQDKATGRRLARQHISSCSKGWGPRSIVGLFSLRPLSPRPADGPFSVCPRRVFLCLHTSWCLSVYLSLLFIRRPSRLD